MKLSCGNAEIYTCFIQKRERHDVVTYYLIGARQYSDGTNELQNSIGKDPSHNWAKLKGH